MQCNEIQVLSTLRGLAQGCRMDKRDNFDIQALPKEFYFNKSNETTAHHIGPLF